MSREAATDRVALVTGAAQGVGLAIAARLARDGVRRMVLLDRNTDALREAAAALAAAHGDLAVSAVELDLAQASRIGETIRSALSPFGRLDILVNAAGVTTRGGLHDLTPETFDNIFAINTRAPLFVIQAAAPLMPRGAVIINICSMLAYGGPPFLLGYSASKAALATLTKGVANTLKRDGVRAFGVNLGWTVTPSEHVVQTTVHGLPESWAEDLGARQPFGRLLTPEDAAGLVSFLASPDALMMTGAIIDLDQFVAGTVDDNPGAD